MLCLVVVVLVVLMFVLVVGCVGNDVVLLNICYDFGFVLLVMIIGLGFVLKVFDVVVFDVFDLDKFVYWFVYVDV